ncbi:unnamed protein product [Gongylonema pulchrum]|uniref:Uncharacterized protein n=1 Tax=Gongylonema pulchrum TaxID=637853 RepID=A0A183DFH8_9BILA|nr:unnamed protein product [Gongylonema pulchrum]
MRSRALTAPNRFSRAWKKSTTKNKIHQVNRHAQRTTSDALAEQDMTFKAQNLQKMKDVSTELHILLALLRSKYKVRKSSARRMNNSRNSTLNSKTKK